MRQLYSTLRWRTARAQALSRDGSRCTVSRLLGGSCAHGPLHVHHIVPVDEGGQLYELDNLATVCSSHHPTWEALRRRLISRAREPEPPRCPHRHLTAEGRELCERRLSRASRTHVAA